MDEWQPGKQPGIRCSLQIKMYQLSLWDLVQARGGIRLITGQHPQGVFFQCFSWLIKFQGTNSTGIDLENPIPSDLWSIFSSVIHGRCFGVERRVFGAGSRTLICVHVGVTNSDPGIFLQDFPSGLFLPFSCYNKGDLPWVPWEWWEVTKDTRIGPC